MVSIYWDWINLLEYIDTHCHLNLANFEHDRDQVLLRANQCGVTHFIVPGYDLETSRSAIALAEKYQNVFAAVGVHPNSANEWDENVLSEIIELSSHPKVVAIGEIGLDYYRDHTTPEQQLHALIPQVETALSNDLPVIFHSRQAEQKLIDLLQKHSFTHLRGVFHAFEGSLEQALQVTSLGFVIGVGGQLTYKKNERHRFLISSLTADSLILETDAPFLSPVPLRGTRNEPSNIPIIAELVANLLNCSIMEIAQQTTNNALKTFSIVPSKL